MDEFWVRKADSVPGLGPALVVHTLYDRRNYLCGEAFIFVPEPHSLCDGINVQLNKDALNPSLQNDAAPVVRADVEGWANTRLNAYLFEVFRKTGEREMVLQRYELFPGEKLDLIRYWMHEENHIAVRWMINATRSGALKTYWGELMDSPVMRVNSIPFVTQE